jgi:class 3 adenylate cyclase
MTEAGRQPTESSWDNVSLKGFYVILALANLMGAGLVFVANMATPLKVFPLQRAVLSAWSLGQFVQVFSIVAGVTVFYMGLLIGMVHLVLRPIRSYLKLIKGGGRPTDDLETQAKARLINLPFVFIPICGGFWLVAPALVICWFYLSGELDLRTSVVLAVRSSLIGLIAATISFFLVELFSRRRMIPRFFPHGKLTEVKDTAKLSIDRRIRAFYRLGSVTPMVILVVTLLTLQWQVDSTTITARDYGAGILTFSLILMGVMFVSAGALNRLVSHSIADPVRNMVSVVDRVQAGDYTARIAVISNDEIGVLGDAGNDMIRGLAERERLRTAFGKYVTPEIGREILSGRIPLAGERREATVMFADLRGFTPYVESHPPEEVIADMRAYFTAMHRAINAHQGVVLQFVGDGIEAVFGVPVPYEKHAEAALRAALDMRSALAELNREFAARGKEPFTHGVGIHTGAVLAGNTGSEDQSAYALIGDTVNVASRIEGLTKTFGCDLLVSEATVSKLEGRYFLRERPPTEVKGFSKPIVVYSVDQDPDC